MRCYQFIFISAVLLTLTPQAHAQPQRCTGETIGQAFGCSFHGRPGEKICEEPGTFSPCRPTTNPPPPLKGTAFGKYLILDVIYAPPGTNSGKSNSQVSYEADSSTGSTKTNVDSFKTDFSVSANVECTDCDFGILSGGASFEYTTNDTRTDAYDIKKTASSTIQVPGPSLDGVDHNHDQIWLLLHPLFDFTISGQRIIWSLDPIQSAGLTQYLYVGWLKNPSKIPPGVLHDLQVLGFTAQDFEDILNADPLAQCLPPVVEEIARTIIQPIPPCATPLPTGPRYVSINMNLPYDPPLNPNDAVPTQIYTIDNSSVTTHTDAYQTDTKIGITVSGGFNFLNAFKATLKTEDSLTWSDLNSTASSTGSEQKMSLTLGGPAFGYTGPNNMDVYIDTLFQTFVFVPNDLSIAETLHGRVLNGEGKPVHGQLVTATAGEVKYRTYTNANGQYRFPRTLKGPIHLQAGAAAQQLTRLDGRKSVDFRLR